MNKKIWYWIAGILIVAGIIYAVSHNMQKNNSQTMSDQKSGQMAGSQSPAPAPQPSPAPAPKKLSYGQAINTYKFRFQFSNCHASPGMISVKTNTPVMLDNRDNKAHTIKANGQSIKVAAQDYALIYPKTPTGAGANLADSNMTCDGGGAGTLNVEK